MALASESVALNSPTMVPTGWFSVMVRGEVKFKSVGGELIGAS